MNINKKLYPTVLVLAALILLLALVSSATALATGQSTSPTITEIQITKNFSDCPAIYDNKIVWQDKRNGNWNIYMYDLSTKKETQITTNKFDQINPDIYGNKVVWQDERKGNWDIYMYDLSTKKETQITTNASNSERPDIYGDKIVWSDDRNGKGYDHGLSRSYYSPSAYVVLSFIFIDEKLVISISWDIVLKSAGDIVLKSGLISSTSSTYALNISATLQA